MKGALPRGLAVTIAIIDGIGRVTQALIVTGGAVVVLIVFLASIERLPKKLEPVEGFASKVYALRSDMKQIAGMTEMGAKLGWHGYLRAAVDHPEFLKGKPVADQRRYELFVTYLLASLEGMLPFTKEDPNWMKSFKLHLQSHKEYLSSEEFLENEYCVYSAETRAFIDRVRSPREKECPNSGQ